MLTKAKSRYEEGDRYQALKLWEQALKQVLLSSCALACWHMCLQFVLRNVFMAGPS